MEPVVHTAQGIFRRHFAIVEDELTGVGATHAEFVQLLRRGKSGEASLDEECRDPTPLGRITRLGIDDDEIEPTLCDAVRTL